MTERLPSHNFDWFALLEIGFVPADIWISWFGPFAFVKPSLSHLRVLELECWISPETSFVFSMSNHPHFRTGDIHIFRVPCMVGYSLLRQIAEAIL